MGLFKDVNSTDDAVKMMDEIRDLLDSKDNEIADLKDKIRQLESELEDAHDSARERDELADCRE